MKKIMLSAISALCLAALSPLSVSADTYTPQPNIYKVQLGHLTVLYEEATDSWYRGGGESLDAGENVFHSELDGFTCDLETGTIYNPDGSKNESLSIMCHDTIGGKNFTFDHYEGTTINEESPAYDLALRMDDSLPYSHNVTLCSDRLLCTTYSGGMPVIQYILVFDSNFAVQDIDLKKTGEIMIEHYSGLGDINIDGKLTVSDAVLYARVNAEDKTANISKLGLAVSDINGDGKSSGDDLNALLSDLAGLTTNIKPNQPENSEPELITTTASAESSAADMTGTCAMGTSGWDTPCIKSRNIEIAQLPYQTKFGVGQKIDLTGCKVSCEFTDAHEQEILKNVNVLDYPDLFKVGGSALEAKTPGEYEITITYQREFSDYPSLESPFSDNNTVSFPVTITAESVTPAAIPVDDGKMRYIINEKNYTEFEIVERPELFVYAGEEPNLDDCIINAAYYEDGVCKEKLDRVRIGDVRDKLNITWDFSEKSQPGSYEVHVAYPNLDGNRRFEYTLDTCECVMVEVLEKSVTEVTCLPMETITTTTSTTATNSNP